MKENHNERVRRTARREHREIRALIARPDRTRLGDEDIPRPDKYNDKPEKMSFVGKVTRCEPPHVLEHTWEFGEESSEVCYKLEEQGDKVRLVLTHRRLESSDTVLSVSCGWHTHLNLLVDVLESKKLRPFYKMQLQYESEYGQRLGLG
jgi:hypothetical protein